MVKVTNLDKHLKAGRFSIEVNTKEAELISKALKYTVFSLDANTSQAEDEVYFKIIAAIKEAHNG